MMKNKFAGFYPPTETQYKTLWSDGLVVLDTNVLLNLYRLPMAAREEFLGVLELVKARLWIPYHVGLEFQRRRVSVILETREKAKSVLAKAQENIQGTQTKVAELELLTASRSVSKPPLVSVAVIPQGCVGVFPQW